MLSMLTCGEVSILVQKTVTTKSAEEKKGKILITKFGTVI